MILEGEYNVWNVDDKAEPLLSKTKRFKEIIH